MNWGSYALDVWGRAKHVIKNDIAAWEIRRRFPSIHYSADIKWDPWCAFEMGEGSAILQHSMVWITNETREPKENNAALIIGKRTGIGEFCNVRTGGARIEIGDHTLLSQFCTIIAHTHHRQGRLDLQLRRHHSRSHDRRRLGCRGGSSRDEGRSAGGCRGRHSGKGNSQ